MNTLLAQINLVAAQIVLKSLMGFAPLDGLLGAGGYSSLAEGYDSFEGDNEHAYRTNLALFLLFQMPVCAACLSTSRQPTFRKVSLVLQVRFVLFGLFGVLVAGRLVAAIAYEYVWLGQEFPRFDSSLTLAVMLASVWFNIPIFLTVYLRWRNQRETPAVL